jgi:hypothetical protein
VQFYPPHDPAVTPAEKQANAAAYEVWAAKEEARVQRQRQPLSQFVRGRGGLLLIEMMLDRAWALLDAGECEAADALLEFLPKAQAEALLNEFFKEDEGGGVPDGNEPGAGVCAGDAPG